MKILRLLLFPFSILYALVVILRNLAFDLGILKSQVFDLPLISVGNLAVGGSGKSPVAEYLIRLLKDQYKLAVLSRGYGRNTRGFLLVSPETDSLASGDEPLQFKLKFNEITVAVCEDRVRGIQELKKNHQLIILDDAFQHRAVKPGLSILLFEYSSFNQFQWLLPTGNLREPYWGIKRADIVLITKCPEGIQVAEKQIIKNKLALAAHQDLFFSYFKYGKLKPLYTAGEERDLSTLSSNTKIILLTGIANASPLLRKLHLYEAELIHHEYPDHHQFNEKNIAKLVDSFNDLNQGDNLIITTEKDAQRLNSNYVMRPLKALPIYYLPVEAVICANEQVLFDKKIKTYASKSEGNN